MPWRDEIESALPPPRDDDPARLRRDILDELADHLECAMDREMRRADDATAARKRALARFGSPQRIALKLWLDAMKERIMTQRILLGTNIAMFALLLVMFIIVLMALRQNQRLQADLIDKVAGLAVPAAAPPADAADLSWPRAVVRVEGGQGPFQVELRGELYNPGDRGMSLTESIEGGDDVARFGPVRAGRHTLRITDGDAFQLERDAIIPPGVEHEFLVTAPQWRPQPVDVSVRLELPEEIAEYEPIALLRLAARVPDLDERWQKQKQLVVTTDGRALLFEGRWPAGLYEARPDRFSTTYHLNRDMLRDRIELDASLLHTFAAYQSVLLFPLTESEPDVYREHRIRAGLSQVVLFDPAEPREEIIVSLDEWAVAPHILDSLRDSLSR